MKFNLEIIQQTLALTTKSGISVSSSSKDSFHFDEEETDIGNRDEVEGLVSSILRSKSLDEIRDLISSASNLAVSYLFEILCDMLEQTKKEQEAEEIRSLESELDMDAELDERSWKQVQNKSKKEKKYGSTKSHI